MIRIPDFDQRGAIKWVEIGAALIEWEDQPATLNLLTDITARKQGRRGPLGKRERIEGVLLGSTGRHQVSISNRAILEVNDTFCRIDRLFPGSADRTGSRAAAHPTTEDYDYVGQERYRQISEKGTGTVEARLRRKDGEIVHVLLSATPIDKKDLQRGHFYGP